MRNNTENNNSGQCGVGEIPEFSSLNQIQSLTIRTITGDYRKSRAGGYTLENTVAISKKNKTVLEEIIKMEAEIYFI